MSVAVALIPVEEYLETSYSPDCDYLDGALKGRNVGQQEHSRTQNNLAYRFTAREDLWGIRSLTEQRIRTGARRYRVADVCVVRSDAPWEPAITAPPLLCVEILSESDRIADLEDKIEEYLAMGVEMIWVIDPGHRRAWHVVPHNRQEPADGILRVPGTEIAVPLAEVFAGLP